MTYYDGTAFTPADVALTFNMLKSHAAVNLNGLKISSVTTSGNNVTLNFPAAQYTNLQSIAGTAIVPQAIWSKAGDPATFADPNPVGTGPFKLGSFTPQGFSLVKDPDYTVLASEAEAGYTMGGNGFFQKGGKTVSLTIVDPSAYTDYAEVDSIVAQEPRAAGVNATFQGLSVDAWNSDVAGGNFQLTSHWPNGGITPYRVLAPTRW